MKGEEQFTCTRVAGFAVIDWRTEKQEDMVGSSQKLTVNA